MILAFSGIDGSGKTTVATEVQQYFLSRKERTKFVYLGQYFLLKCLVKLFHKVKGTKFEDIDANPDQNPFLGTTEKPFYLKLWIFFALVDSWFFYTYLKCWSLLGYKVICDRYFYDKLVGFEHHGYSTDLLSRIYLFLMPMPDRFFVLDISPKTAKTRETNGRHPLKFYKDLRRRFYLRLPKRNLIQIKVDNKNLDEVVSEVLSVLET